MRVLFSHKHKSVAMARSRNNFLHRLFKRPGEVEQRSAAPDVSINFGGQTWAVQNPDVACKISAVYSAVKLISERVAALPCVLKRYNNSLKYYAPDFGNPLYNVLAVKPNNHTTAYNMWQSAVVQILLNGNAYLVFSTKADGKHDGLILLYPNTVTYDPMEEVYMVYDPYNGISGNYREKDIIHLRNMSVSSDGRTGDSVLQMAAKALGIAASANEETANMFTTGARFHGIITAKESAGAGFGRLQEGQVDTTRNRIKSELAKGEQITYLPDNLQFTPISMTASDIELLNSKIFSVREIARFFRVDPSLLYEGTGGNTYSNVEMNQVSFLNNTLEPILRNIEMELTAKLIDPNDYGYRRIEFDRERLYMSDPTAEANYMKATIEAGVMTINDWRKKKGMPSVPDGDTIMVSANTMTLNSRINGEN